MNKLFIIAAIFSLGTAPALAAPSLQGSTGLINTQTADVLRDGQFTVGADSIREGTTQNIVIGIGPQLELGMTAINYHGQAQKALLNGKFALLPEKILVPGLSIGIEDAFNKNKRTEYVVMSKTLPFGFRLHVGTGNGRYGGAFAGLETSFNPMTTLLSEYDGSTMNYGIRLTIAPGLKVEGGMRSHSSYYGINFTM